MSGICSLFWGCVSDRFGRKLTTITSLVVFVIASIICVFAHHIAVLIVFRAIEGGAVSATLVVGQALVADIYPEEGRGYTETIIGVLFVPCGVAMFTTSITSGWLSDKASKYYGHERCPEGRLVPALALSTLHPIGLAIYGWTFHYK
ncbi:unnamed protein product, partial [Rotaria sp. Silwood1]